jgi:hypothetical protein
MKIPKIDFKYWLIKNQNDSLNEKRFIALITKIINIYQLNKNYKQAYFCGDSDEISRLKSLNYVSFENEIIEKIKNIVDLENDEEILKVFDLIQIWGGLQGGSNFYNIIEGTSLRLNYKKWLPKYKELIKLAILKNKDAYNIVTSGEIPNLRMSFGSKHISFWSRKINDNDCLVIIDNKIAGVSGALTALDVNYSEILTQINNYSKEFNLKPFEIEKSLFTFHRAYFNNSNTIFFGRKNWVKEKDYESALIIFENLNIDKNIKPQNKPLKIRKNKVILDINVEGFNGILASIDWNSNKWSDIPTNNDITNSDYRFVIDNGYSFTFLNFGHNLFPTNENGYYQGCLPCLFSKNINSKKENLINVVFIYSKNWEDGVKYIVGLYAFPKFNKTTKSSPVSNFNRDIIVNIMSYPEDIHILENKYELQTPLQNGILPPGKNLSRQSFNYLSATNVINIFDEIIAINNNDEYLINIASRVQSLIL